MEFDVFSSQIIMRLGMPTLVGAYMWYLTRTGRFQSSLSQGRQARNS
jgi:hypothetical protein